MHLKQKLKGIYKVYWRTVQYYFHTKKQRTINAGDKVAEINFGEFLLNMDRGRYSFTLCQILKFSGFEVIVKLHPKFFIRKETYRKWLLAQDFTRVRNTSLEKGSIELHGLGISKSIKLVYGYTLIKVKIDAYYLPYTLHPRFYLNYKDNTTFEVFREAESKIRVFFAGNFERSLYSRPILKADFEGTITRIEIMDHIKAKYSKDSRISYSATKEDLYVSLTTKSIHNTFIISEVKTPEEDWLSILSKTDFYLCLPGGAMPWSHNAIECMAVGTIPILQYNKLFNPHLVHLENCIAYDSFDTFNEAIEFALNMKEEQVLLMKQQVIEHYDMYLSTERTINRIQEFFSSEEETLTIALPFLPRK